MFGDHRHHCGDPSRARWRGFGHEPFSRWRGHGRGRERMFDGGELRLVILALIAEKPRHGYEIIKELSERVGGGYSPSPGVVYPTLTMIEEMGYARPAQDEAGRKLYSVTLDGEKVIAENKAQIDAIFARFTGAGEANAPGAGSVFRAMMNLRAATRLRLLRGASADAVQAIVDALDEAAKRIEKS